MAPLNLIKLVVGLDTLEALARWQEHHCAIYKGQPVNVIHTRFAPKRAEEILNGSGSIYRVMKGQILCRQQIVGFDIAEHDARGKHCLILTSQDIMRTIPTPRRPFQGWRYLEGSDAPQDAGQYLIGQEEPQSSIEAELKELGLL